MPFRFESLQIWRQARALSRRVYEITARFPDQERYSLTSQMTWAADSISLNIAEGAGRNTADDFNRFLGMAMGSTFEVAGAAFLALDRGYIDAHTHTAIYNEAEQLARSINSFRKTLDQPNRPAKDE
jgi:four helix bundle protein